MLPPPADGIQRSVQGRGRGGGGCRKQVPLSTRSYFLALDALLLLSAAAFAVIRKQAFAAPLGPQ